MSEFGRAWSSKNNITFSPTEDFPQITIQVLGGTKEVNRMYASAIRDKWNEDPQAVVDALLKSEISALRAKVAELEKDAARYRFIRDTPHNSTIRFALWHQQNKTMDATIDSAMKGEK